jgi:polyisoprenoid-binding protein YceI
MSTTMHDLASTADGRLVPASGTWQIDPAHTAIEFVARHLMVTKVRGRFSDVSGTIEVADNPLDSAVSVTIQTASVTTGAADRDGHLVSPDFFDVDNHPEMTFVSTGVRSNGDAWTLDGDLTIKGVTKPVALNFDFVGVIDDPYGNSKAAFSASVEIMREDWGLTWNVSLETGGVLVSKKIAIEIEIQAALAS